MSPITKELEVQAADDKQFDMLLRPARGGTLIAAAGMLIFAGSVLYSFVRLRQVDAEITRNEAVIAQQVETLREQGAQIAANEQRLETLSTAAARGFGLEAPAGTPPSTVEASLVAHDALIGLAKANPAAAAGQKIVYYAKSASLESNQENFITSLRELGFTVDVVRPRNATRASNALWFGTDVSPAAVELAAYALMRAGYQLQYIGRFQDSSGDRARTIQIGVRPRSMNEPVITPANIEQMLTRARPDPNR